MNRLLLLITGLLLIFSGLPLFAEEELELGLSFVPIGAITEDKHEEYGMEPMESNEFYEEPTFMDEWIIGFHVAYNWGILYASLDSFALPAFMIQDMTRDTDEDGYGFDGHKRPGFINFIDVGAKFTIGDIVLFGTTGINTLYVYRQAELPPDQKPGSFGTNLRVGASYKFAGNISVGLTGTAIFPNFQTMGMALQGMFGNEEYGHMAESVKFLPMLMGVVYL